MTELTPTLLMALRITNKGLPLKDNEGAPSGPYITLALWPGEGEYVVHSQGYAVAKSTDSGIALALLRSERIEAGFCRRVLGSSEPIDEATQSPEARARLAAQRASDAHAARMYKASQDEAAAEARRRRAQLRPADVASIGLDQLLDPGFNPHAMRPAPAPKQE